MLNSKKDNLRTSWWTRKWTQTSSFAISVSPITPSTTCYYQAPYVTLLPLNCTVAEWNEIAAWRQENSGLMVNVVLDEWRKRLNATVCQQNQAVCWWNRTQFVYVTAVTELSLFSEQPNKQEKNRWTNETGSRMRIAWSHDRRRRANP